MESFPRSGQRKDKDSRVRAWGDDIMEKRPNVFRVGANIIGGLPLEGHGAKLEEIWIYLSKLRLDAVGLTECSVHWKMVPVQFCLPERM